MVLLLPQAPAVLLPPRAAPPPSSSCRSLAAVATVTLTSAANQLPAPPSSSFQTQDLLSQLPQTERRKTARVISLRRFQVLSPVPNVSPEEAPGPDQPPAPPSPAWKLLLLLMQEDRTGLNLELVVSWLEHGSGSGNQTWYQHGCQIFSLVS